LFKCKETSQHRSCGVAEAFGRNGFLVLVGTFIATDFELDDAGHGDYTKTGLAAEITTIPSTVFCVAT
jgi:hypothetical protein